MQVVSTQTVMNLVKQIERLLNATIILVILSILLMVAVMPDIYLNSLPDRKNEGAIVGISLAIGVRVLLISWLLFVRWKTKRHRKKRKEDCVAIGILLVIFGLIYSDGAVAFSNNEGIEYVSVIMFTSVLLDLAAAVLIFIVRFKLKDRKRKPVDQPD